MYAAYRPADAGHTYWRFANFLFPFWTHDAAGRVRPRPHSRAWVPMDDTHTMFISLVAPASGLDEARERAAARAGVQAHLQYQPNTDRLVRPLAARAAMQTNDWLIDREAAARSDNYTGIDGIHRRTRRSPRAWAMH